MTRLSRRAQGFTLMELLIAIAIVAILAAIAVPTYLHYTTKAYYSEVVQTAERYKIAVSVCIKQHQGKLADCDAGTYGIPPNITAGTGQISSVTVKDGVISVIPNASNGIAATDTYVLTPTYQAKEVSWKASGGGCTSRLASGC